MDASVIRPLVVVPTKDNEGTIATVVGRCLQHTDVVLVVDDGCQDGTRALAERAGATVVAHATNQGKGAALQTALGWAREHGYTHVVALDADGQHNAADLPAFFAAIGDHPSAIVVGVRDLSTAPGSSNFGRSFSNFWVRVETGRVVGDSQCGFRAYPVAETLALRMRPGRYEWEVEVLVRSLWAGRVVHDIPCDVYYPTPEERVSSFRPFWDNVRISLLNTRLVAELLLWPPHWRGRLQAAVDWRGTHLGPTWGWWFFLQVLKLFGRWPTYAGMFVLATFYFAAAGAHRRAVQGFLARVSPTSNPMARLAQVWRLFFNFAIAIVDRFVLMSSGPQAFQLVHEYEPGVTDLRGEGCGFIVITSHMGNSDLGAVALKNILGDRKVNLMLYAADGDPYLELLRSELNERAPNIIAVNDDADFASLRALRALKAGEVVAIKADRPVDEHRAAVPLFGAPAHLPTGPYLLAALARVPVIHMACFKEGGSTYRVVAHTPKHYRFAGREGREDALNAWAGEFGAVLERWATRYPEQWYNFHDVWASAAPR